MWSRMRRKSHPMRAEKKKLRMKKMTMKKTMRKKKDWRLFYNRSASPGTSPSHYDKATTDATKKPNAFIEATRNTNKMMTLIVPTGKSKTVSIIHSLGVVDDGANSQLQF